MQDVYIISAKRTPIGSFGKSLSTHTAVQLGSMVVKDILQTSNLEKHHIQELFMGNVIGAGLGQAPATQVAIGAGLGDTIPCTLINKVCASGMKAIMIGAQSIMLGQNDVVIAGGMESMSNIPYYLTKARYGYNFGNSELIDGLTHDGLTDAYNHCLMGVCADHTASSMNISRSEQDDYAIQSYTRAEKAWKEGKFKEEVTPVEKTDKKGNKTIIAEDEEYTNVNFGKIPNLRPVFSKQGSVTAANASTLNDGASALLLMSKSKMQELGCRPLAKIKGFADSAQDPMWFTTSPSIAVPKALKIANLKSSDINYYEINEAFSVVALANMMKLNINPEQVNINGGAVALGHPLGASGARITVTLAHVLKQQQAALGVAAICNGGGGASALVIEHIS